MLVALISVSTVAMPLLAVWYRGDYSDTKISYVTTSRSALVFTARNAGTKASSLSGGTFTLELLNGDKTKFDLEPISGGVLIPESSVSERHLRIRLSDLTRFTELVNVGTPKAARITVDAAEFDGSNRQQSFQLSTSQLSLFISELLAAVRDLPIGRPVGPGAENVPNFGIQQSGDYLYSAVADLRFKVPQNTKFTPTESTLVGLIKLEKAAIAIVATGMNNVKGGAASFRQLFVKNELSDVFRSQLLRVSHMAEETEHRFLKIGGHPAFELLGNRTDNPAQRTRGLMVGDMKRGIVRVFSLTSTHENYGRSNLVFEKFLQDIDWGFRKDR